MSPLALTDQQLDRVTVAAALLPQHERDGLLRSVANRVGGLPEVGAAEIEQAINCALNNYSERRLTNG